MRNRTPVTRPRSTPVHATTSPAGESIREMQARIVAATEEVVARHPGELIVLASHADPIKAAVAHFTGVHLDLFQRLFVSPASCTVLRFGTVGAALVKLNDTGSLAELRPPEEAKDGHVDTGAGATTDLDAALRPASTGTVN